MKKRRKWDVDSAMSEAKRYQSKGAFGEFSPGAYAFLKKRQLLDEACIHMIPVYNSHNRDSVMAVALSCKTRSEFLSKCPSGVQHAKCNGYYEEACAHMAVVYKKWTLDMLLNESAKYKLKSDFFYNCPGGYSYAAKNGLIDIVCAHMPIHASCRLTDSDAINEAKKYSKQVDFKIGSPLEYGYCRRHNLLNEACSHMDYSGSGYSTEKPAILYYIKFVINDSLELYKIGITNRSTASRLAGMGLFPGVCAEILAEIRFASGLKARQIEKALQSKLASFRYSGPGIMKNGNTELFTENVLGLS